VLIDWLPIRTLSGVIIGVNIVQINAGHSNLW
jgi:hypothetical protein